MLSMVKGKRNKIKPVLEITKENNLQKNDEILYSEWVPTGKFVKTLVSLVFILIASLGIIFTAYLPIELAYIGLILGGVCIFIFLIFWNYRWLQIILTKNQLEVSYGVLNHKRIPLNQITKFDITKAYFKTYGGVGIRFGMDGSWAYNTDFGDAVKLTLQSGKPFLFSTKSPQKICDLLQELL